MTGKRFTIKSACPQCGCSDVTVLTEEEIKAKYGDSPQVHLSCSECSEKYLSDMKNVCPEWDAACKLKKSE